MSQLDDDVALITADYPLARPERRRLVNRMLNLVKSPALSIDDQLALVLAAWPPSNRNIRREILAVLGTFGTDVIGGVDSTPTFDPANYQGSALPLSLFLDGNAGTLTDVPAAAVSTDPVATWQGQYGTTVNASQSALSKRSILDTTTNNGQVINGLTFTADVGYMALSEDLVLDDFSIFAVVDVIAAGDVFVLGGDNVNNQIRYGDSGNNRVSAYDGSALATSSPLDSSPGDVVLLEWVRAGSTLTFYENGVSRGTAAMSNELTIGSINALFLGSYIVSSGNLTAYLIAVYRVAMDDNQRKYIENGIATAKGVVVTP